MMKATMRRLSMSPTTDNETRSFVTDGRAVGPQNMTFIQEPNLRFRYDQALEDPRDGLRLFGPLDHGRPYGIRAGVVGTAVGIEYFRDWTRRIQAPLSDTGSQIARPPFPGFETVFGIPWAPEPRLTLEISAADLRAAVFLDDSYQRVFETVAVFTNPIVSALLREESDVDVWFVVIPDVVYENCRPRSRVSADQQVHVTRRLNPRSARRLKGWPSLFEEENRTAVAYHYDVDFRNQLKARLLDRLVSTQIIRESTIAPIGSTPGEPRPKRDVSKYQAAIAWKMCTAAFYKAGGRPWKMDAIRDGVCYVGLVFKQDEKHDDPRAACCAAQMFLDSGDGLVFRGAVGPWHTPGRSEFHLSRDAAKDLAPARRVPGSDRSTKDQSVPGIKEHLSSAARSSRIVVFLVLLKHEPDIANAIADRIHLPWSTSRLVERGRAHVPSDGSLVFRYIPFWSWFARGRPYGRNCALTNELTRNQAVEKTGLELVSEVDIIMVCDCRPVLLFEEGRPAF